MKNYQFSVWFEDGTGLKIWAATPFQAVILAMAQQIKDAKEFGVDYVEDEKGTTKEVAVTIELKPIVG